VEYSLNNKLNNEEIRELLKNYTDYKLINYKLIDKSRGENDIRYIYIINCEDDVKLVIKVNRNDFTTHERIKKWSFLCETYLSLGIICPQILKTKGKTKYSLSYTDYKGISYVVYGEEYKKLKTIEEYIEEQKEINGDYVGKKLNKVFSSNEFRAQLAESIGKVATAGRDKDLVPWNTAFVLYDKFCDEDLNDENYEFALKMYESFRGNDSINQILLENIWRIYTLTKTKFEKIYRRLPKAVFQGDLNDSNLMIDNELNFKGLLDFNLSGTETILNYALCEGIYCEDKFLGDKWISKEFLDMSDNHLKEFMKRFCRYYTLSQDEINAINTLYNILCPFRFPYMSDLIYCFKKEKYSEVNYRLKWTYYQLTRKDINEKILNFI